jgi:hypothetical protein
MATPNFSTVPDLSSANMDVIPTIPGATFPKLIAAHIAYDGADWAVDATVFSAEIVSGALAYDTDHLVITASGFVTPPAYMAMPGTLGAYQPIVTIVSATEVHIEFHDFDHTPITTEDTDMDFMLWLLAD